MADLIIRKFNDDDTQPTAQVFFDAVRMGAAKHYSQSQREAWAPDVPETMQWQQRMSAQTAFVAEHQDRLVGFMTLTRKGCIDLAFVVPNYMGCGVAHQLYEEIASAAKEQGLKKLSTEATPAPPKPLKKQSVTMGEAELTNFLMTKEI